MIIPEDNRILYFGRDRERFGFLSHFHLVGVQIDGDVWATVVGGLVKARKCGDTPCPAFRRSLSAIG
jgi:predicted NAD-dependent protein-ADP-ribosyltransferase YbiA (DUF1768 family)